MVFGWSAGLSVQLSRLLGSPWLIGEPIFVFRGEVVCWLLSMVGWMVVVVCWGVVVTFTVIGLIVVRGLLVVNSVGLMVAWAGLVAAVVSWVLVGRVLVDWVGADLLFDGSWKSGCVLTVAEDPGSFVGKVLEVGSWSWISKFTEAFAVKVAGKDGKEKQFYLKLGKGIIGILSLSFSCSYSSIALVVAE